MTDSKMYHEADSFLTSWHKAAAEADAGKYFSCMDDDFVFLGTDAKERWTKTEFITWAFPHFQGDCAWVYSAIKRDIVISDDSAYAWFDEILESEKYWTSKGSGVLYFTANGWKLKLYSLSFTIPNEIVNEIAPTIKDALKSKNR